MHPLILQSDFGNADGAVCAMYGVAQSVSPELKIYDLTHEIPQYDIWEASYRLLQTVKYWEEGTVFVSVVDPGVGSERKSIVVKTTGGRYIVTPDNGTLTHIKRKYGIVEARIIDENVNRLPNSGESYTFHGRDVYAYTGARLAAGIIKYEEVGPLTPVEDVVELSVLAPETDGKTLRGYVDVLDVRYGSLWTNIGKELIKNIDLQYGDKVELIISTDTRTIYHNFVTYAKSFSSVNVGEALVYINSLDCLAVAINQGSFAKAYSVGTGIGWKVSIRKSEFQF